MLHPQCDTERPENRLAFRSNAASSGSFASASALSSTGRCRPGAPGSASAASAGDTPLPAPPGRRTCAPYNAYDDDNWLKMETCACRQPSLHRPRCTLHATGFGRYAQLVNTPGPPHQARKVTCT